MTKALARTNYKILTLTLIASAASAQTLEHSQDPALINEVTVETEAMPIRLEATDIMIHTPSQPDDNIPSATWPFSNEVNEAEASNKAARSDATHEETLPEVRVIESEPDPAFDVKDLEQMIEGLLSKKRVTGALVGTTISAALSAHPVGAFLGGLIGAMVGKESKYKPSAEASSITEQDLFAVLDKLAEDRAVAEAQQPEEPPADPVAVTREAKPQVTEVSSLSVAPQEQPAKPHTDCYQANHSGPRNRAALKHCFYYAY